VVFLADGKHALRLENGAILVHTLSRTSIESKAAAYMGRNVRWEDWQGEFEGRPYAKLFPDFPSHVSVTLAYLQQAKMAVQAKRSDDARAAYQAAAQWAAESGDPYVANEVCWSGSLDGFATFVLSAGEFAVRGDPANGNYRDTRGVARAMTGDLKGALADLEAYIPWAERMGVAEPTVARRRQWIDLLRAGRRPDLDRLKTDD
jgi:hypothetical protein